MLADRGQCSQIVPPLSYSGTKMLDYTYSFRYAEGQRKDFDYLIQRRRDGSMILGGGRSLTKRALFRSTSNALNVSEHISIWLLAENMIDVTDDSMLVPDLTKHLKTTLADTFENWGETGTGEGLVVTWTGIMGVTHDTVPYVGQVEDRPNQYINAVGFHCSLGIPHGPES